MTGATNGAGITLFGLPSKAVIDSTISHNYLSNNRMGIHLICTHKTTLLNNTVSDNTDSGISLSFSSNNILTGNSASNNNVGIGLWGSSSHNKLTDNNASNNADSGIYLSLSNNNVLTGNSASNNNVGIGLWSNSSHNKLTDNNASDNNIGIGVWSNGVYNILSNNHASNNKNGNFWVNSILRDSKGDPIKHNGFTVHELQEDYTVDLIEYFSNEQKLPDGMEKIAFSQSAHAHIASLPTCEWDFIHLENGKLTIKQGYRWDGASNPVRFEKDFNIRSSLVHDSMYDLMRLGYLEPDKVGHRPNGAYNRIVADMMLFMIAVEDGQDMGTTESIGDNSAYSNYKIIRSGGASATNNTQKITSWKFHVSELKATVSGEKVELEWSKLDKSSDDSIMKHLSHIIKFKGYKVQRNGISIDNVLQNATSYVDNNVTDGSTYYYQIVANPPTITIPIGWISEINITNMYDWSNTAKVTVYIPPTVDVGADSVLKEGDIYTNSGNFTDPGNDIWTATVDYGDGTGVQPLDLVGKNFSFNHTYSDNGVYTVTVTVSDDNGSVGTDTAQVTVNNVAPTVHIDLNQKVNEGDNVNFSGNFTDPGLLDTHTIEWDFGDGGNASGTLTPTHAYGSSGVYPVTLKVTDNDGGVGVDVLNLTVNNTAPIVSIDSMVQPNSRVIRPVIHTLRFSGSFTDSGWLDTHNITWNFGDGTIVTGTLTEENEQPNSTGNFTVDHAYSRSGDYIVTLTVTDDDGDSGTAQYTAISVKAADNNVVSRVPNSGELASNILLKDVTQQYVAYGKHIEYHFKEDGNCIVYIEFDSKENAGQIYALVEMLAGRSTLTSTQPSDKIYQDMNILVGNGFETFENIENAVVGFKVERSWISENNIDETTICLCRNHNGKWDLLSTQKTDEDEKYIYFESKTPGFSPFVITAEEKPLRSPDYDQIEEEVEIPEETAPETLPGFEAILTIAGLLSVAFFIFRKEE